MPTVRYEIRNEFGLSDPELYREADDDDPEALLEAVAMAGLIGVLRQLGDLAEFAAEIFHALHEEVTATAARGHGLMLRIQQLEADFPSIEKAFLSQTNPCPMSYNEGIEWHANLRRDQTLVTQGDMPRFILDSYEECRGGPRLFMLDKFDVAGAGACLKRYSDPSFFKVDLASSGMMEEEVREKKARKIKKKGSRWRNGDTTESFLSPLIRSNLQPVLSEKNSAKVPMRHVKLKSRNLIDSDITNRKSSMEHLLQVHLPEQKALSENSSSDFPIMVNSIDQVGSVPEEHGTLTNTAVKYPMVKKRNCSHSAKNDSAYFSTYEKGNQEKKAIATFEPHPDEKMVIESKAKRAVTVYGPDSDEVDEHSAVMLGVDQKKSFVGTQITTTYGFDGNRSANKNRTEDILDAHSSDGAEIGPSGLPELDQRNSLTNIVFSSEGCFDGYRSDDVGSDLENYMDALNTMGSENETDSESREKSDPGILNMEAHRTDGIYKRQQELPAHFSEPFDVGKPTEKAFNNMLKNEVSAVFSPENSGNLTDTHPPEEGKYSSDVSVTPEIFLDGTNGETPEEMNTFSMVQESVLSVHLLTSETRNANASEAMSTNTATVGLYSSSCISESTSCGDHVCLQASNEAQSVTIHPTETFSGYTEGNHQIGPQLNGNVEELFKCDGNSEIFSDELLHVSDLEGSSLGEEEAPEDDQFMNRADEVASVTLNSSERFLGGVENTYEVAQQLNAKEEVFKSADFPNINELLLSPDMGSPFSASKVPLEETHPADYPEEQISEIPDGISMLDHLSLTEDCSNLDDAPRQFDEATLFTVEMISHMDGEQQQSIEQETEALSGVSTSIATPTLSANISSAIMKSDVLPVEMEGNEKPENSPADVSTDDLRLSQGFGNNLDGNVPCIVHSSELLSKAYDAIESLEHAAKYSPISCDDLLPVSDVPERTDTAGDAEELFSEDACSDRADNIPKEAPIWCDKDSTTLFSKEDTETCSGQMIPATNCHLSIETSPFVADPCELAANIGNVVAPFEDSTDDDLGHIKILKPNFLPCELEQFSAAEEPQNSHEKDSTKILPWDSANNAFPDGRHLPSTEPICAVVTGGTNLITDNLKSLCGTTTSNLHKEERIGKNTECDDSLDEYVVVESDDDNLSAGSIYSPMASAFDVKLQEDYLPCVAFLDWNNMVTNETSHPKNMTLMPEIDDQPISSTYLGSESPSADSVCSSDAKLVDGACQTVASEHKESSLFSLGNEDAVSREGNEPNLTSSHQEGNHLEASNIPFERAFSDEQNITRSNSEHIDGQPLKPYPVAILTAVEMNKLDIPSSDIGLYEQQEAEAVPSKCTSEISVGSMASHISATVLPVVASSSADVLETSPQNFLEPQVAEATFSLKLQGVEGTPSLPPLPPLEWRTGKLRFGSLGPVGDTAKLSRSTNPFTVSLPLERKHPQGSVKFGVEVVRPTPSPLWENELVLQRSLNPEQGQSDLPPNANEDRHQHGMNPPNPSLLLCHPESERNIDGHDALALEDMINKNHQLLQGEVRRTEDKRPRLSQLLPSLELERSQHESICMVDLEPQPLQVETTEDKRPQLGQLLPSFELERSQHESISMGDLVVPVNPFLAVPSSEEWKQYGYGLYGGERMQHLNLLAPLSVTGPNMPPYGFLYPMGENPSMIYDFMVPAMGGERPNWKPRSIRDRPRNPLIEAVAAHDKSKMRKVSELDRPQTRPKADERDSLLEQIRNKSSNLKPANAPKVNMKGPPTNLKLAAILEKANAIRQAFVGSDEEDDAESWNDS